MRLLSVRDYTLHDFPPNQIPKYVVLSHRWIAEETTLEEFAAADVLTEKAGIKKIKRFCQQAAKDGHAYAWVDTCCIDKKSSAELSEAINSMFKWYRNSVSCYAYLEDVTFEAAFDPENTASLMKSQWFSRGWTLQELLAPDHVTFYSSEWIELGTKVTLANFIGTISGIDTAVLKGTRQIKSYSVAQRMSWAADRITTREEDIAYALLGLFGVNMPMLYGEGIRAFLRLQEEIMSINDDQSIFAWTHMDDDSDETGLLALHPRNFRYSGAFLDMGELPGMEGDPPMSTSRGISLNAVHALTDKTGHDRSKRAVSVAVLKCAEHGNPAKFATIRLIEVGSTNLFHMRLRDLSLKTSRLIGSRRDFVIRHEPPNETIPFQQTYARFTVSIDSQVIALPVTAFTSNSQPPPVRGKKWKKSDDDYWLSKHSGYVSSNAIHDKYYLPLFPGANIAFIELRHRWKTLYINNPLLIGICLTEEGQIGFTATNPNSVRELPFDKLENASARTKPFVFYGDNGWYHTCTVSAADLSEIQAGEDCVINIDLNRGIPVDLFHRYSSKINHDHFNMTEDTTGTPLFRLNEAGLRSGGY